MNNGFRDRAGHTGEAEKMHKDQNAGDAVMMLADGNGEYAAALGLEMDGTAFGMGIRGQRFALIVDDGVATHVAVEQPGKLEVSAVEAILGNL